MHNFRVFSEQVPLRVQVPKWYVNKAQSTYVGTHLGLSYLLFEYWDPLDKDRLYTDTQVSAEATVTFVWGMVVANRDKRTG